MPLTDLNESPLLDVTIDGANEIDIERKVMIVAGGGVPSQLKIMAKHSKKVIIIADFTKRSKHLTENWKKGIPIEVIPRDYESVKAQIGTQFAGEDTLRITENLNYIINWNFQQNEIYGVEDGKLDSRELTDTQELLAKVNLFNQRLKAITGVIDTGIFAEYDLFPNKLDLTIYFGGDFN